MKEQIDILPDLSQELASMGRGSMQRLIERLKAQVTVASTALAAISDDKTDGMRSKYLADTALERIQNLETT